MRIVFCLFLISFLFSSFTTPDRKVENIRTFAKVYGYVHWFYPGDEATQIDWNRFAVYGVQKVENAKNDKELRKILLELFRPIAPAIQIEYENQQDSFNVKTILYTDTICLPSTSWVHYGVFLTRDSYLYKSIRTNRDTSLLNNIFLKNSIFDYSINSMPDQKVSVKNQEYKFSLRVKSNSVQSGNVYLYLASGKYKNFSYKPEVFIPGRTIIRPSQKWEKFEKIITAKPGHKFLSLAIGSDFNSCLLFDSISVMYNENGSWKPLSFYNHDFSQNLKGWTTENPLFDVIVDTTKSDSEGNCVKISRNSQIPKLGEFIKKNIGNHLICVMPLALSIEREHTYPVSNADYFDRLNTSLAQIQDSSLNTNNIYVRLANILIVWNVFQHFYPYFDVVHANWENELELALQNVYSGKTEADYFIALSKLVATLEDGHGTVRTSKVSQWGLPLMVSWIENKIVVIATESKEFQIGDIIQSINGKSALEELYFQESFISGSPQLKQYRALNMFSSDFKKSEVNIRIIRNGNEIEINSRRTLAYSRISHPLFKSDSEKTIINCGNGIYYLNKNEENLNNVFDSLKGANGIIIGPGFDKWELIPHIIQYPVWSAKWEVPITLFPDREKTYFIYNQWDLEPKQPYLNARLIFLINPSIISNGETMLGIINNYNLGETVGDTTAGTNGNTNYIPLMGGYGILWTGMKVLKHDGSQLHLIGFCPDYPVNRTIKAVQEGRDEYLEKAIEVLMKEIKP